MKNSQIRKKFYADRSEAKKKYRNIKEGPKNLNFGASKPGVKGGTRTPGPPPPGSAPGYQSFNQAKYNCGSFRCNDVAPTDVKDI